MQNLKRYIHFTLLLPEKRNIQIPDKKFYSKFIQFILQHTRKCTDIITVDIHKNFQHSQRKIYFGIDTKLGKKEKLLEKKDKTRKIYN